MRLTIFLALMISLTSIASAQYRQTRSVTYARKGMACTSDPRASQAAVEILRAGGSAVDAAIAANAVLGVVEPMSCGIGGDLFSICWDAKSKQLDGLNASGRSPKGLTLAELTSRNLDQIPLTGELSWSVPGCVLGWSDLHTKHGRLPWKDLFTSAIHLAEEGFPVAPVIAGYWQGGEKGLRVYDDSVATYLIASEEGNFRAPRAGEVFRNPRLAATYRAIAEQGPTVFYRGFIAEKISRFSQHRGGFLSQADFAEHRNSWVDPVSTNYRGFDVWELPPNGQGIAVLQMLNILEQYDLQKWGWGSADYIHHLIEAKKLAFADRAHFYADPDFADVPVDRLISKAYAVEQARRILADRASMEVPAGDPRLAHGDTIYLCVVDGDRNCCSLIQSNFHGFGSQMVPADLGFVLQNRGCSFTLEDGHPNQYAPGKRPFHTIIPAMVTKENAPYFVFGVMGGDMQPQGHVQVLVNLIDFQMNVQMAGDAPRVRHDGSATPTGLKMAEGGGLLLYEADIPETTLERLREMGHRLGRDKGGVGGYQGILVNQKLGILEGATESRKDGLALGLD
jgi:gamma-glutamyltranspeptidase/glutathione hydrolase